VPSRESWSSLDIIRCCGSIPIEIAILWPRVVTVGPGPCVPLTPPLVIRWNFENRSPSDPASNHRQLWFAAISQWQYYLSWHFLLFVWIFHPEAGSSMSCWNVGTYLPYLYMESTVISVILRCQYEWELFDFQEDTVLSLDCSTHLYISSCTRTTCLLLWDLSTRNTSGGRDTSLVSRWLVASQLIKYYFYLKLRSLNIPYFCHDVCLALQ
jgi:hypothetical protein